MREDAFGCAQLQHDAGLILSNIQVLQQFVTSLNRMSSEVMHVAFDREPFPSHAVQNVAPSHRVRRAAHYMAAMGLWCPPITQGFMGPCRRRRVTLACRVLTVSRIYLSSSVRLEGGFSDMTFELWTFELWIFCHISGLVIMGRFILFIHIPLYVYVFLGRVLCVVYSYLIYSVLIVFLGFAFAWGITFKF